MTGCCLFMEWCPYFSYRHYIYQQTETLTSFFAYQNIFCTHIVVKIIYVMHLFNDNGRASCCYKFRKSLWKTRKASNCKFIIQQWFYFYFYRLIYLTSKSLLAGFSHSCLSHRALKNEWVKKRVFHSCVKASLSRQILYWLTVIRHFNGIVTFSSPSRRNIQWIGWYHFEEELFSPNTY